MVLLINLSLLVVIIALLMNEYLRLLNDAMCLKKGKMPRVLKLQESSFATVVINMQIFELKTHLNVLKEFP